MRIIVAGRLVVAGEVLDREESKGESRPCLGFFGSGNFDLGDIRPVSGASTLAEH